MARTSDVCIVGGGLQGCAAALELARRGFSVIVVERDYPGRQSSGLNAGGVRRMDRDMAEVPLSLAAHKIWLNIEEHVGDSCGFVQTANIAIIETKAELAAVEARVKTLNNQGLHHESIIAPEEVSRLVPTMTVSSEAREFGAIYCPGDGFASPFRTTNAFCETAGRAGATFLNNTEVISVKKRGPNWAVTTGTDAIEARILLNCAGAWGNRFAAQVGDPAPVHAEAPMMTITAPVPPLTEYILGFAKRRLSFKQRENGTLLIGGGYRGTVNGDGLSSRLSIPNLAKNALAVLSLFPQLKDVPVIRSWSGVEGLTPDQLPIIGPGGTEENLFHAFGFSSHGFQLGPVVGRILADLVETGTTDLPISDFSINRFRDGATAGADMATL